MFHIPQHILNAKHIKNKTAKLYDWTEKKDGFYLQVFNGVAFSKTGRNLGPFPFAQQLEPNLAYELEGYGKTLADAKKVLGCKRIVWDKLTYFLHNCIIEGLTYQQRVLTLPIDPNLETASILLTGTIQEAELYAKFNIWNKGGEGLVGRVVTSTSYASGARNQDLVKVKSSETLQARCTGITPGTEQVWFETESGVKFSAKAMNRTIIIGKWYTIECMKINSNGVPREPVIQEA